jgi:hypothetical protein
MKSSIIFAASLALVVLLSGCATEVASVTAAGSSLLTPNSSTLAVHNQTVVTLGQPNFVVVKPNVMGQSRGFALLGLITIVSPESNVALSRLYAQADVQPGHAQTLANLLIEKSSSYWILFSLPRLTVRADLVEFVTNNPAAISPACCQHK